jgi:dolichol-phosphate mannosyltransferase
MPADDSSSNILCSIIIPTYNERDNIPILLWLIEEACSKACISYEVIIVDDASPDGTQQAVQQMQQLLGADKVVLRPRAAKLGLGTAYRHGLQYARGSWIILMDADLSHHPKYIPTLFKVLAVQHQACWTCTCSC